MDKTKIINNHLPIWTLNSYQYGRLSILVDEMSILGQLKITLNKFIKWVFLLHLLFGNTIANLLKGLPLEWMCVTFVAKLNPGLYSEFTWRVFTIMIRLRILLFIICNIFGSKIDHYTWKHENLNNNLEDGNWYPQTGLTN